MEDAPNDLPGSRVTGVQPDPSGEPGGRPKLKRSLGLVALIGVVVLVVLAAFTELGDAWATARQADAGDWFVLIGLTSIGYGLRWVKWHAYVRRQGPLAAGPSLHVFLAGLFLSLTPGKLGEMWKAWAVRDRSGIPVGRVIPVILMERLTDIVALAALAALGLAAVGSKGSSLALPVAVAVLLIGAIVLVRWEGPWTWLRRRLDRHKWAQRLSTSLDHALDAGRGLLRPAPVALGLALSLGAWALEGATLWWALRLLGSHLDLLACMAIFAAGTLAGAASFLPGGLIAAELGMVGLLVASGIGTEVAAAATLLVRLATLWYGAAAGALAFAATFARRKPANKPAA